MTTYRFLAFSCLHVPKHDHAAVEWLSAQIADHKPHYLICLGDLLDANAASRWPNEYHHTLAQEYDTANNILIELRKRARRDVRCVWTLGNHDANILAPNRIKADIRSLVDFRKHMSEVINKHWQIVPYIFNPHKGVYRLGQVTFCHGYEYGQCANENQAILLGRDWGLFCMGHTHRPSDGIVRVRVRGKLYLNRWYANPGMMCNADLVDYAVRRNTEPWGCGCVVGEAMRMKSPREGRYWDAELRLFSKPWDNGRVSSWHSALTP